MPALFTATHLYIPTSVKDTLIMSKMFLPTVSDIPRIGSATPLYATSVGNNVTLYCDVVSELAVTSVYWEFIAYGT
jgi:hypothetical protein